jgi:hypothetical protein
MLFVISTKKEMTKGYYIVKLFYDVLYFKKTSNIFDVQLKAINNKLTLFLLTVKSRTKVNERG